jgi:hypothetical protein
VLFKVSDYGKDPFADLKGIDAVGKPAVVGLGAQTGIKIEMPGIAAEMRDCVLVDLCRRNDKYGFGESHDARVEEGEEIPEEGMGDEPVFQDGDANVKAVNGPRVIRMEGGLDLKA